MIKQTYAASCRRRRTLIAAILILALLSAWGRPLTWFALRFHVEDALMPSDALVVLLGQPNERAPRAAELYLRGIAPVILIAPARSATSGSEDNREIVREILMQHRVPADAIRVIPGEAVGSTRDEALRVRDYARGRPVRRITIVTTAYHTNRTREAFRGALQGLGVEVRMAASRDPRFTESDWYTCSDGIYAYLSESVKTVYYRLAY